MHAHDFARRCHNVANPVCQASHSRYLLPFAYTSSLRAVAGRDGRLFLSRTLGHDHSGDGYRAAHDNGRSADSYGAGNEHAATNKGCAHTCTGYTNAYAGAGRFFLPGQYDDRHGDAACPGRFAARPLS